MQAESDSLISEFFYFPLILAMAAMHTILKGALSAVTEAPPGIQPTQLWVQGLPVAGSLPFLWNRSGQVPCELSTEAVVSVFLQRGLGREVVVKDMEEA
jgi:hypothetical protein